MSSMLFRYLSYRVKSKSDNQLSKIPSKPKKGGMLFLTGMLLFAVAGGAAEMHDIRTPSAQHSTPESAAHSLPAPKFYKTGHYPPAPVTKDTDKVDPSLFSGEASPTQKQTPQKSEEDGGYVFGHMWEEPN